MFVAQQCHKVDWKIKCCFVGKYANFGQNSIGHRVIWLKSVWHRSNDFFTVCPKTERQFESTKCAMILSQTQLCCGSSNRWNHLLFRCMLHNSKNKIQHIWWFILVKLMHNNVETNLWMDDADVERDHVTNKSELACLSLRLCNTSLSISSGQNIVRAIWTTKLWMHVNKVKCNWRYLLKQKIRWQIAVTPASSCYWDWRYIQQLLEGAGERENICC